MICPSESPEMPYPTEAELERAFYHQSPMTALEGWVRCSCGGSCGVDIPVTLQWDRTTDTPVITHYPNQCPDSKALLHSPPSVSEADLWRAWYDAVNERVTEGMVADPFDLMDPRD